MTSAAGSGGRIGASEVARATHGPSEPRPRRAARYGAAGAALDASDAWHHRCVDAWRTLVDPCITTEAVVTEACNLVARGRASAALPVEFLLAADIPVVGLDVQQHQYIAHMLRRYADVPMDFANATLVAVAAARRLGAVFTIDRRGFATYRRASGAGFQLLPEP